MMKRFFVSLIFLATGNFALAAAQPGSHFDHALIVIFENTNYADAMAQPFFGQLASRSANLTNMLALTHPSQGNYIALTSGSLNGVHGDRPANLTVPNIVDLLETHGLTWKVYAEDYPGNCFTGATSGNYARKHNPLISYLDIQKSPARCANIVNANQFDVDVRNGTLPNYMMYIPNLKNDGHDTGIAFANKWYAGWLPTYINNQNFMKDTVLISTFDESGHGPVNHIYTTIYGSNVKSGDVATSVNVVSLLKLIEDNWGLGDLGQGDASATAIPDIWSIQKNETFALAPDLGPP